MDGSMDRMSSKDKLEYSMSTLGLVLGLAVKSVKENYGEDGIANLRKTFYQAGINLGKSAVERLKIKDKGPKGYHPIVEEALKAFNVNYEVVELSDTNYVLRIYDCPHARNFKAAGDPAEVCDVFLELDEGIVKALNPKLEFELTKHILRGDPYCEYVVRPQTTS